jgi:hypothetical protein
MLYPLSYGGSGGVVAARAYNKGLREPCRYGDCVRVLRDVRRRAGIA